MNTEDNTYVLWLTGLPGSGKTTLAKGIVDELLKRGLKAELLDGDELRRTISSELGFSKTDREIHGHRVIYLSNLLLRNGVIPVVALISPYRSIREYARQNLSNFVEIWIKCPLETCARRDPKGLYKRAQDGKVSNVTGIQDPYEPPIHPDLTLDTEAHIPVQCIEMVLEYLREQKFMD